MSAFLIYEVDLLSKSLDLSFGSAGFLIFYDLSVGVLFVFTLLGGWFTKLK